MIDNTDRCEQAGVDGQWIELHSGNTFRLDDPVFNIDEIAHSLSLLCRYNGHTNKFFSVASHSLLVAHLMQCYTGGDPMEGLLHDATEAYLSDVPAPFKQFLPDWKQVDKDLTSKIRDHYYLPPEMTNECKEADCLALLIEAYYLMPSQGKTYVGFTDQIDRAHGIARQDHIVMGMFKGERYWRHVYYDFKRCFDWHCNPECNRILEAHLAAE